MIVVRQVRCAMLLTCVSEAPVCKWWLRHMGAGVFKLSYSLLLLVTGKRCYHKSCCCQVISVAQLKGQWWHISCCHTMQRAQYPSHLTATYACESCVFCMSAVKLWVNLTAETPIQAQLLLGSQHCRRYKSVRQCCYCVAVTSFFISSA